MNARQVHTALIAVLALLGVSLLASLYFADGMLQDKSQALANLKAEEQAVIAKRSQFAQDKKDITTYTELNNIAKTIVPQDKDQAKAVREIVNLASASGIPRLSSVAFSPSTLGGTAKTTTQNLTQVTPVKDMPGVFSLSITVQQAPTSSVPYNNFITFLSRLEQNRRTAQVSSISVTPDQKNPGMVSFSLVIEKFIKP
jgi:hypothetical protein